MITIRSEKPADFKRIHSVTNDAFGQLSIADLIYNLRDDGALLLSQVALLDDEIVGHAGYSLVSLTNGDDVSYYPGLGPIAVAPAHQKQGIGSALVRAGLQAMRDAGYGLLFLVGAQSYYPRFGFQPAQPLGFTSDYVKDDGPHEHFMVAVLDDSVVGKVGGHIRFHPAFAEAEAQ